MKQFKDIIKSTSVLFLLLGCKPTHYTQNSIPSSWKEDWISNLMDEYLDYHIHINQICPDDTRDFYLDFATKIQSIREYPFKEVFEGLQTYTKFHKIKFDSILMVNISHPSQETIEHSCPSTYIIFFKSGNTDIYSIGLGFCEKITFLEKFNNQDFIKTFLFTNFTDGCFVGYVSYTMFDKNWQWKILKIAINPEGTEPIGED